MDTFKIPPFRCPCCGSELLIDRMRKNAQDEHEVVIVLDVTDQNYPSPKQSVF